MSTGLKLKDEPGRTIVRDDFPAPVRPHTPTFSPPLSSKLTSRRMRSKSSRYLAETLRKVRLPVWGHDSSGCDDAMKSGASGLSSMYSCTRSTETMFVSTSVALRTVNESGQYLGREGEKG